MNKKLDSYHYHEALHMAFSFCEYIDLSLISHPVYEEAPQEIKNLLHQAQNKLHKYYEYCSNQQDKLDETTRNKLS